MPSSTAVLPPPRSLRAAGLFTCMVLPLLPGAAAADESRFTFHAEPAVALWIDEPQSTRFTPGFYGAARPGLPLGRVVALELSYAYLFTPAEDDGVNDGGAHLAGGGLRVRPFARTTDADDQLGGLFVDAHANYVRTGDLDRFGADAGLGYVFQLSSAFALGPVVRYTHILQPDELPGVNANDGQLLSVGVDLAFGAPYRAPAPPPASPACPQAAACPDAEVAVTPCPDRDADGVCDTEDRCPTQAGPAATYGCTIDPCGGAPLYILVQFPFDSANLPSAADPVAQSLDPVLDAVAGAIAQDASCRVCVIGHASEEGTAEHNQTLSLKRAEVVQAYLEFKGLTASRLPFSGVGERCPLEPASSLELNRRVEFRRIDKGDICPTDCSD